MGIYPNRIPTPHLTLQYEGLFDFDGMYAAIIDWAKNYQYQFFEKDYKHKVPDAFGAEQEWKWKLSRRIDPYVSYEIVMHLHAYEMVDVEVKVNGKKKMLTKTRMYLKMNGICILDWQNRFAKGGKLGQFLGDIYMRVFKHDISGLYWDTLVYRVYNLHSMCKNYMDMMSKKYTFKGYLGED